MKKIFNLLSVSLLIAFSSPMNGNAASAADDTATAPVASAGAGSGGSHSTAVSPAVVPIPDLDTAAMRAYFGGRALPKLDKVPDLDNLPLSPLDIYIVVATALAHEAAKNPNDFRVGTVLDIAKLKAVRMPTIFAGWTVTNVLNNMQPPAPARTVAVPAGAGSASSGDDSSADLNIPGADNASYSGLFGLTVMAPTGFKIAAIRSPVARSLKELVNNTLTTLNGGNPVQALNDSRELLLSTYKRDLVQADLNALGIRAVDDSRVSAADISLATTRCQQLIKTSAQDIDGFIRQSEPHAVAGDLSTGALAAALVRSYETRDGNVNSLAKNIKYVGSFNTSESDALVECMREVTSGPTFGHFATPVTPVNYSLSGPRMMQFLGFNRRNNMFANVGKPIGGKHRLPAEPVIPERSTAAAAAAAPAPAQEEGGMFSSVWAWLRPATSTVAPAPVAAAEPPAASAAASASDWWWTRAARAVMSSVVPASAIAPTRAHLDAVERKILRSNDIREIMREMLWAYLVKNPVPVVAGGAAAGAGLEAAPAAPATPESWDEVPLDVGEWA